MNTINLNDYYNYSGLSMKILFEGIYRESESSIVYIGPDESSECWHYIRFYPDCTVITVTSTGAPEDLKKWFSKDNTNIPRGTFSVVENLLSFSTASKEGKIEYEGKIDGKILSLDSHSYINDSSSYEDKYEFVEW